MKTRVPKSGWRARCAANDDLLLAAMLAVAVIAFVGGFFLFIVALADLATPFMGVWQEGAGG